MPNPIKALREGKKYGSNNESAKQLAKALNDQLDSEVKRRKAYEEERERLAEAKAKYEEAKTLQLLSDMNLSLYDPTYPENAEERAKLKERKLAASGLNKYGMVPSFRTKDVLGEDGYVRKKIVPERWDENGQPVYKDLFSGQEVTVTNPKYRRKNLIESYSELQNSVDADELKPSDFGDFLPAIDLSDPNNKDYGYSADSKFLAFGKDNSERFSVPEFESDEQRKFWEANNALKNAAYELEEAKKKAGSTYKFDAGITGGLSRTPEQQAAIDKEQELDQAQQKLVTAAYNYDKSTGNYDALLKQIDEVTNQMTEYSNALPISNDAWKFSPSGGVPLDKRIDPEYNKAVAATEYLQNAKDILLQIKAQSEDNRGYWGSAWQGIKDNFANSVTDLVGTGTLASSLAKHGSVKKFENGEPLTQGDQALLTAIGILQYVNQTYAPGLSAGYKAGASTIQAIPYMALFVAVPTKAVSESFVKAGMKTLGKAALRTAGEDATKATEHALMRAFFGIGKSGLTPKALRIGKLKAGALRVGGDLAAAGTVSLTAGLPSLVANTIDKRLGEAQYKLNDEGKVEFTGMTGARSWAGAFGKAFLDSLNENFSEMSGDYFNVMFKPFTAAIGKLKIPFVNKTLEKFSNSATGKFLKKGYNGLEWLADRSQFNGFFGEWGEEIVGGTTGALLMLDDKSIWEGLKDVYNLDNFIETANGLWMTSAAFGLLGMASYRSPKYYAKNRMLRAEQLASALFGDRTPLQAYDNAPQQFNFLNQRGTLTESKAQANSAYDGETMFDDIKHRVLFGDQDEVNSVMKDVFENRNTSPIQKQALLNYIYSVQSYKAMQMADAASEKDGKPQRLNEDGEWATFRYQKQLEKEFGEGYNIGSGFTAFDYKVVRGVRDTYNQLEEAAKGIGYTKEELDEINDNPQKLLELSFKERKLSDTLKQTMIDYMSARARYEGMIQSRADEARYESNRKKRNLNNNIHLQDGKFHHIVYFDDKGEEREGSVIYGQVKTDSDENVIIRDSETGETKVVKAYELYDHQETILDPKPFFDKIDAEAEKQLDDESKHLNGEMTFNEGEEYIMTGTDGQQMSVTIVKDNENGTVDVLTPNSDGQPITVSKTQLQARHKEQQEEPIKEEEKAAVKKQYIPPTALMSNMRVYNTTRDKQDPSKITRQVVQNDGQGGISAGTITPDGNVSFADRFQHFNSEDVEIDPNLEELKGQKILGINRLVQYPDGRAQAVVVTRRPSQQAGSYNTVIVPCTILNGKNTNTISVTAAPEEKEQPEVDLPKAGEPPVKQAETTTQEQQAAVDALNKYIEDTDKITKDKNGKVRRTGHDYFIEIDGKTVMFTRVHGIIGDLYQYYIEDREKANNIYKELNHIYENEGEDAYIKRIKELVEESNKEGVGEPIDASEYYAYVKQSPEDYKRVSEAIASLISFKATNPSLKVGSEVDAIARDFFENDPSLSYEKYSTYFTEEAYNKLISDLKDLKEYFDGLGWAVSTKPTIFYGEFVDQTTGKTIQVAGETDMIAVDKSGNYHILDFKTSKKGFDKTTFENPTQTVAAWKDGKVIGQRLTNVIDGKILTTKMQYERQLTMYLIMSQARLGGQVSSISIIPFDVKYDYNKETIALVEKTLTASNHQDGQPVRIIPLTPADSILSKFISPTEDSEQRQEKLKEVKDKLYDLYKNALTEYRTQENLTADNDTAFLKLIEDIEKLQGVVNSVNAPQSVDNLQQQYDALYQQYNNLLRNIAEQQTTIETNLVEAQSTITAQQQRKTWITQESAEDPSAHITSTYAHNQHSVDDCVATDGSGVRFADVSVLPDFLLNCVAELRHDGKRIQIVFHYGGHTFTPINIKQDSDPNVARKFYGTVAQAYRERPAGTIVVIPNSLLSRTNGVIKIGKQGTLIEKSLVSENELFNIEFNGNQSRFLEVRYKTSNGVTTVEAVTPSATATGKVAVYPYGKLTQKSPSNGSIVTVVKRKYNEVTGEPPTVPITLRNANLTAGDALLITDILSLKTSQGALSVIEALNKPFVLNGRNYGLSNRKVLELLLPFGASERNTNRLHLDVNQDGRILIVGSANGQYAKPEGYDMSNLQDVADFKKFITDNVTNSIVDEILRCRLNENTDNSAHPLYGMRQFLLTFSKELQEGKEIRFGNSSIAFDMRDFVSKEDKPGTNEKDTRGISGLAWYIKHGRLVSEFEGFEGALVAIDTNEFFKIPVKNFYVDEKSALKTQEPVLPVKQSDEKINQSAVEQGIPAQSDKDLVSTDEDDDWIPTKAVKRTPVTKSTVKGKSKNRVNEEAARENVKKILGENGVVVSFLPTFLQTVKAGWDTVGLCYHDAIILSKFAEQGVEYHEAFHRVTEILLDPKEKERVYNAYRKALLKKGRKNLTDAEVAEGLADEFMFFATNKPTINAKNSILAFFRKIKNWISALTNIGSYRLWKLYRDTLNGRFAEKITDPKRIEQIKKNTEEYKKKHGNGLPMLVRRQDIPFVDNNFAYKELRQSVVYMLYNAQDEVEDIKNPTKEDVQKAIDYCKKKKLINSTPEIESTLQNILDNWETIQPDIVAELNKISFDVREVIEDEEREDADAGELDQANETALTEHSKASYESSQLSRASQRVKSFFSGVMESALEENEKGELVPTAILNSFGLPLFTNTGKLFNLILNKVHDKCGSYEEMLATLERMSQESGPLTIMYTRLKNLYDNAMNGSVNERALLTLITRLLHANKNGFVTAKAVEKDGKVHTSILNSDSQYLANRTRQDWSEAFALGSSYIEQKEDGTYKLKDSVKPDIFHRWYLAIANRDPKQGRIGMVQAFSPVKDGGSFMITVDGERVALDPSNPKHVEAAKNVLVKMLNGLGIQFSIDDLNYMLDNAYGSSDAAGMKALFEDEQDGGILGFASYVDKICNTNGQLNITSLNKFIFGKGNPVNKVWFGDGTGFVGKLTNWKYAKEHDEDQLTVLVGGKRFYVISQNNEITDVTNEYSRSATTGEDTPFVKLVKSVVYNWIESEKDAFGNQTIKGSAVLKAIKNGVPFKVYTLSEFKTDHYGDTGLDYASMTEKDDVVSKMTIVTDDGLVFPTMSDKKTWVYIKLQPKRGQRLRILPGIDYNLDEKHFVMQEMPSVTIDPKTGKYTLTLADQVAQQLLEYAECEHAMVQHVLADSRTLKEEEKVANFHNGPKIEDKNGKKHTVVQGARYSTLVGVYDVVEGKYQSFNYALDKDGNYMDEEEMIKRANIYFFSMLVQRGETTEEQKVARQKAQISRLIQDRVEDSLDYLEKLGLIKFREGATKNTPAPLRYVNNNGAGLDDVALDRIYKALEVKLGKSPTLQEYEDLRSQAVFLYVSDVEARHIMSLQEIERLYSGHPASFKFKYNKTGTFYDRTTDQRKRFGGLVSTGENNDLQIERQAEYDPTYDAYFDKDGKLVDGPTFVDSTYKCAEVDNEMIEPANIESLSQLMYEGEVRNAYLQWRLDELGVTINNENTPLAQAKYDAEYEEYFDENDESVISPADEADRLDIEEIKARMRKSDTGKILLDLAEKQAKDKTNSFRKKPEEHLDGVDVADGAAYISDEMAEMLLRQVGNYNEEIQQAFEILRNPKKTKSIREMADAYQKVYTAVIGTQKYTAYGFRFRNGVQYAYYNKMALFPMFKCICTGNMAKIFDKMKQLRIDMLMVNSAVKLGSQGCKPITWEDFNDGSEGDTRPYFENSFSFNTYNQEFKYLRKQFNTDPKDRDESTMGTLMTKVVMAAIMAGRSYAVQNKDGKTYSLVSAKQIRDNVMEAMNKLSDIGKQKIYDELFDKNVDVNGKETYTLNKQKFSKMLQKELQGRGASREVIESVSVSEDDVDFLIPMDAISNMNFIESILISRENRKIIDINTPGEGFIQRSVWGMEGATNVLNDDNLPPSINDGKELQMINEEGSMDCVLSIDAFESLLPKRKMSFDEKKQWLINNGIIGPNATANMVAYRIPTQAISSIHALRCVDVLPVVRHTIILPKEFTKITGSDFDIDKIYFSMLSYKHDKEAKKLTTNFEEGSEEFYKNQLLFSYIALLKDSKYTVGEDGTVTPTGETRSAQKLHASIDKDTEKLTDLVKQLYSVGQETPVSAYEASCMYSNTATKDDFMTGKKGIGPYALNNNSHILTMLFDVKFKPTYDNDGNSKDILTRLQANSLSKANDRYGQSIMSWISGLINAHVDVAKDPYIGKLNVNAFTYNLSALMVRTGFGKDTFYFLGQPIMRELAKAVNGAESKYGAKQGVSTFTLKKQAEEKLIYDYLSKYYGIKSVTVEDSIKLFKDYFKKDHDGVSVNLVIDKLLGKNEDTTLKDIFSSDYTKAYTFTNVHSEKSSIITGFTIDSTEEFKLDDVNGKKVILSMQDVLMLTYIAYTQFRPYAEALSKLVKYAKIDTKKQGKNLTEMIVYKKGYKQLFDPNMYDDSSAHDLFDAESLKRLINGSYIQTKTDNSISTHEAIMSDLTIRGTGNFKYVVDKLLYISRNQDSLDVDLHNAVANAVMGYIRSRYFFHPTIGYCLRYGIVPKSLVSGNNTISDRLRNLKLQLTYSPKYAELRDSSGQIKNYLLRVLVNGYQFLYDKDRNSKQIGVKPDTYEDAKFIRLLNYIDTENLDEDEIRLAWDELLNDTEHEELQKFARDLVVYSFMTSAGNSGRHNLFRFVPNSWVLDNKDGSSYADFMKFELLKWQGGVEKNEPMTLSQEQLDDIILNNWNTRLVPNVFINDPVTGDTKYTAYYAKGITDVPLFLRSVVKKHTHVRENGSTYTTVDEIYDPRFIKIKRPNSKQKDSQRQYCIYKAISTDPQTGETVYALVDPKGGHYDDKNDIWEYRRSDSAPDGKVSSNNSEALSIALTDTALLVMSKNIINSRKKQGKEIPALPDVETVINFVLQSIKNSSNPQLAWKEFNTYSEGNIEPIVKGFQITPVLPEVLIETEEIDKAVDKIVEEQQKPNADSTYDVPNAGTENQQFDVNTAEFYSGAAKGSDTEWATQARALGIKVKDYTPADFDTLSEEWKQRLDLEYKEVVEELGRKELPINTYAGKLVRRDMMLADKADAVFAIVSSFDGSIPGGTAYAATRAWQRGIPVYVFDQSTGLWYNYDTQDEIDTPVLTQHAAVIGTREINDAGRQAIRDVFEKTFKESNTDTKQNTTWDDPNEFPTDEMNHCKH